MALVLAAGVLAESGEPEYLKHIYADVKDEPLLNLALEFQIRLQLDSDSVSAADKDHLRETMVRLQRKFKGGRKAYLALLKDPKPQRQATDPAEREEETPRVD